MRFLAFRGSFHGRTMGALSLTASKAVQRKGFGPLIAGVHHLAFPDPYRGGTTEASLAELEHVLETIAPPEEVAAIVVWQVADTARIRISPGDIDEAVTFLLTYGLSDRVFPNVEASGFELLRAFRNGFLHGSGPCDVGLE